MTGRWWLGREIVVAGCFIFLLGVTWFRLFEKQVLEHQQYQEASKSQSTSTQFEPAARGRIFLTDRSGELHPVAFSLWRYELLVSPRQVKNKTRLAKELSDSLPNLKKDEVLALINNDKVYIPPLMKNIEEESAHRLQSKNLAGVFLNPQLVRYYPEGAAILSQTLGFVGADSQGKYGLEAAFNESLRGQSGNAAVKKDSFGRLIDVLASSAPLPGADLVLTIDYNLQFQVETKLQEAIATYQADRGTIVVLDPTNGAVLALASAPSFDPNKFFELSGDQQRLFLNPATSEVYEPGSVFKPLTMAAALDAQVVTPETTNIFGQSVTVGGYQIFNAEKKVFGRQNMSQVLENSDNVAMTWVASLLGSERQRDYLTKFGFGQKTKIDLAGEITGRLPAVKDWNDLLRSTAAFGQGISMTPIQLASSYATLVNGGRLTRPHLLKELRGGETRPEPANPATGEQVIKPETSLIIRTMLQGVVERGHGKRAAIKGVTVGGKTGTAEVPNPAGGYFEDRHNGTFTGFFPVENPKFVMLVKLDNPKTVKFAESSAAPTFAAIGEWMATYYQLR